MAHLTFSFPPPPVSSNYTPYYLHTDRATLSFRLFFICRARLLVSFFFLSFYSQLHAQLVHFFRSPLKRRKVNKATGKVDELARLGLHSVRRDVTLSQQKYIRVNKLRFYEQGPSKLWCRKRIAPYRTLSKVLSVGVKGPKVNASAYNDLESENADTARAYSVYVGPGAMYKVHVLLRHIQKYSPHLDLNLQLFKSSNIPVYVQRVCILG